MEKIQYLDITSIEPNPNNPRKTFDEVDLGELSESIKKQGVLQPITVRPISTSDRSAEYKIVCGERRWRAASMAGLQDIPAIVRELTDDEAMDVAITENLQRKDVSPLEESDAFKYLLDKGCTIADLCGRFGKSEFFVRQRLRLQTIIPDFRSLIESGEISISQTMEIIKFEESVQQMVFDEHFSGRCGSWISWSELRPKALYERIIQTYCSLLSNYDFDKAACAECPNCSKNSILFKDVEDVKCMNLDCLKRKVIEWKIEVAEKLQKAHPEADFVAWPHQSSGLVEQMTSKGHEVKECPTYVTAVGEVIDKDIRRRIEDGEIELVIDVSWDGKPSLCYIEKSEKNSLSGGREAELERLRQKDRRNAEIAEEKTCEQVRTEIKEMDRDVLSGGEISDFERELVLYVLLKALPKNQWVYLHADEKNDFLDDEVALAIIKNATPEQKAYIVRCSILNKVGNHTRKDTQMELFFQWVSTIDPQIVPAAELQFQEEYLKSHEKIAARIAAIEMGDEK